MAEEIGVPSAFFGLVDLLSDEVGGRALITSDDFFAEKENLTKPARAIWDAAAYTERGKWMDGWESRRKRVPGHDWCILKLGVPGRIRGVDLDTAFFTGNHAPYASVEAVSAPADASPEWLRDHAEWIEILPQMPLKRGSPNLAGVFVEGVFTHVRLNIFPDGGVARFRLYGEPAPDLSGEIDLAGLVNGGKALACTDSFFSPMQNLILPHRSTYMGGGWETRRSRPPGMDWILVQLAAPGVLDRIVLETTHFKGNFPDRAQVDGIFWPGAPPASLINHPDWKPITALTKLRADADHTVPVTVAEPVTHLRLRIVPDGGVARMRAYGRATAEVPGAGDPLLGWLNALSDDEARGVFARCCGSRRWAAKMAAARPFTSRTHLHGQAEVIWWRLGDGDWLEAFTHHPRIGADVAKLREKFAATADWSAGEQAGVAEATEDTIQALAQGNRNYEARFGHIFIVCATGLAASEMLARLQDRIDNPPANELRIAAGEQAKITRIRLDKLEVPA
jgi:allantoicase